ncbi:SDR family oxidoreductase [Radiobacillus deserti]|uniref:SDR family oxidoreductase n=1 Tax=Radiobacillus deserti TaxID=2594883 RepID=A0A516KJM5_9BACI|nr:SDR family oxidoreductase [Radiobacillus deserti]QDP41598.1 SDR family oxidoreductase [Radiobacillus deserti]
MAKILILGATSSIAQSTAQKLAENGHDLILTSRNTEDLNTLKRDLSIRHQIDVKLKPFDALDFDHHEAFFSNVVEETGGLDGILLMYGAMADQKVAETDFEASRQMIDVNYTSAVSILNIAANYFEKKRHGIICAVSSVAGDRGRKSNYIYGSTKAGLSTYMEGLRNRLHEKGVQVMTVKPGMVDTKMTYGVVKDSPLLADPDKVGKDIADGIQKKKDVLYTPWFWLIIMLVIKLIPEKLFKRMNL